MIVIIFSLPDSLFGDLIPLLKKGDVAPSFGLKSPGGEMLSFQPGSKIAVLVFWSAFCPVCREIIPDLKGTFEKYHGDIIFLTVNVDGERFSNAVQYFITDKQIHYPVAYDEIVDDFFIAADKYGIRSIPTVFFIGEDKRIIDVLEGEDGRSFKEKARKILSGPQK
jgi:thiol-disulfide isomerase/thioredoxin